MPRTPSVDARQRIRLFNKGAEDTFGYAAGEVLGKPLDILLPERFRAAHRRHLDAFGAGDQAVRLMGERGEIVGRHKSGAEFTAEASISRLTQGGEQVFTVMLRDISERKQSEERLNRERTQLLAAEKIAGFGSWDKDLRTGELHWSEGFYRVLGLSPDAMAPDYDAYLSRIHPDDVPIELSARRSVERTEVYNTEYRLVLANGDERIVHNRGECVYDEIGDPIRIVGTLQDITERRRAKEQLLQAQKMEAVGQLTAGIAHDFNNILAAIIGYAELLELQLGPENELPAGIMRASTRGSDLIQRLMAFSRRQSLRTEIVDVFALVHGMSELLRCTLGQSIAVDIDAAPETYPAWVDPGQLENALLNLSINARDAMPEGGRLRITVRNAMPVDRSAASPSTLANGNGILIEVSDTGVGIPSDVLPRVLEPFFTTKEVGRGTGLGLSMVYGLVKQSGGDLTIASEPGAGTVIKMFLPRAAVDADDDAATSGKSLD